MLVIGNTNMFEFKHPKYYKNLRKLARLRNRDQAISLQAATAEAGRTPGTGLTTLKILVTKLKGSSTKLRKKIITSIKPQTTSIKLQARSFKLQDS